MANRPVVLVYQEFATISVPTATPELDCLVVGPAYQLVDYPEDRVIDQVDRGADYGEDGAANPYAPAVEGYGFAPPSLREGAKLEDTSVRVFAEKARALIVDSGDADFGVGTTVAASAELALAGGAAGSFVTAGVKAGDVCFLTDAANPKVTVKRVVRSVAVDGKSITFTSEVSGITHGANIAYRIERAVDNFEVPAGQIAVTVDEAGVKTITVTALQVGGKDVQYAKLYTAYKALRTDLTEVATLRNFRVSDAGELGNVGKVDARNPLAAALFVAAQNTNTPVHYLGVKTDDAAGYLEARAALSARDDVYAVVLLSERYSDVKSYGDAFMNAADPNYALTNGVAQRFRAAIGYAGALPTYKVVSQPPAEMTLTANTLKLTLANATFVDDAVNAATDYAWIGGKKYPIDVVNSNQTITLDSLGDPPLINGDYAVEIRRDLDKDGQVTALVARATSVANRRVVLCWPDEVEVDGLVDGSLPRVAGKKALAAPQPGFYLAAAVGAMTAAMPSHQGFTNFAVNGIKRVYHANPYFDDKQITQISNGGLFVFTQQAPDSLPYIIHELTTDPSTLEFGEYLCVKNMDYVSILLSSTLNGFIGKYNLTEDTMGFMRTAVQAGIDTLVLDKKPRIGSRIRSGKITLLQESSIAADRAEMYVEAKFAKPLNTVGLHIVSV